MNTNTQSRLVWITELDQQGNPIGYSINGDIIDHNGESFPVGEYSPNFNHAWFTLTHYTHSFDDVMVSFTSKTLEY